MAPIELAGRAAKDANPLTASPNGVVSTENSDPPNYLKIVESDGIACPAPILINAMFTFSWEFTTL